MAPTAAPTRHGAPDRRTTGAPPVLDDPGVPGEHLLGPGATEVVAAVLAPTGGEVERTTPTGTTYHRGRSLTVRHDTVVRWPDGRRTTEELVLSSGRKAPEGALVVSDGEHDVVAWRYPNDPWLPGLAPALDPAAMRALLDGLGFPPGPLRCRCRAYRPGRRAVIEVTGQGVRTFLKVVRPHAAEALHRRHQALAGAVPVPASLGWSPDHGIVVLQALPGRTARQVLAHSGALPRAADLVALLDALPATDQPAPTSGWRLDEFAGHVGGIAPALADRTTALAEGLAPFEEEAQAETAVPIHGDLYEAQILVDGGRVLGLLDVDTFGIGRRVDDLATYVGHLVVLATTMPDRRRRIEVHARRLLDGFDRSTDPAVLRARVASVVLGLATGSFRVLERDWEAHTEHRVRIAEDWLASARSVRSAQA